MSIPGSFASSRTSGGNLLVAVRVGMSVTEDLKRIAGEAAVARVKDGMAVGLGTGSTVEYTIRKLAEVVHARGWKILCIATSLATERRARELGLPLVSLEEVDGVDVAIDGADEVDPKLNLIKGGGGAHFREKVVARSARSVLVVVDASKLVPVLGTKMPVPVEVHPFGWRQTKQALESLWCTATLRLAGEDPLRTDNDNYILDCKFGAIPKPEKLEREINNVPGVLENGLFVGLADEVLVAGSDGLRTLTA